MNLNIVPVLLLALGCSALTPSELKANLEFIETNLLVRLNNTVVSFDSYLSILSDYVNRAQEKVTSDLESASQSFWEEVNILTIEAAENGKNISACSNDGFTKFINLQSAVLEKTNEKIKAVYASGVEKLNNVSNVIANVKAEFEELVKKIDDCSSDVCATELNSELLELYQSVLTEVNSAFSEAIVNILNEVPEYLDGDLLDTDQFKKDYQSLLDEVAACVYA